MNPSIDKKNITILYVDDEKVNLFIFEKNFQGEYPVLVASSGPEALDILNEKNDTIIVVISDFKMPEMNGVEFIRAAHQHYDHIFYFILTGYGENELIQQALNENVIYHCFDKPFKRTQIEEKILEAVSQIE